MRIAKNVIPSPKALQTQGSVASSVTYNEVNATYNDARYTYGGFYGFSDVQPTISQAVAPHPSAYGKDTDQKQYDEGITYNQTSTSYNDVRYSYGGLYDYKYIEPLISLVKAPRPSITNYADIYVKGVPVTPPGSNTGMLIGMLGMTYP